MTSKTVSIRAHKRSKPEKRSSKRAEKYPHRVYKETEKGLTLKNGAYMRTVSVKKHKRSKPKR